MRYEKGVRFVLKNILDIYITDFKSFTFIREF